MQAVEKLAPPGSRSRPQTPEPPTQTYAIFPSRPRRSTTLGRAGS